MNQDTKVVKISDVIESQIPDFISYENPNFTEFLRQYYISQEFQGSSIDLADNLVSYKNIDTFDVDNLSKSTTLTGDVDFFDDVISVESTKGFPNEYGLLKIDNEIITYTGITTNTFTGCIRGFSGIETLDDNNNPGNLKFSSSDVDEHSEGSIVINLSNLFLNEIFKKTKYQFTPGFEELDFNQNIDPTTFISRAKDFYKTKGSEEAFKILFKVLYGEKVELINPQKYLFTPSDSDWIVVERFVAELVDGNPLNLEGQTLYQDKNESGSVLEANGSIYKISLFTVNRKKYYNIDIFSGKSENLNPKGSIFGKFSVTPKTVVISEVTSGSDSISVLSTVGFDNSGVLNLNGIIVSYTSKTLTEFLGCSGISETIQPSTNVYASNFVYSYENGDLSLPVRLRLLNTVSEIETSNTKLSNKDDLLKIENLGSTSPNNFTKTLIYNVPSIIFGGQVYDSLSNDDYGIDKSSGIVKLKYPSYLSNGDTVEVFSVTTSQVLYTGTVSNVNDTSNYQFTISNPSSLTVGHQIKFRRKVDLTSSSNYPSVEDKFLINIQSSYEDSENYYLASNSLPDGNINPYNRSFTFQTDINSSGPSTILLGNHRFYDGDIVCVSGYGTTVYTEDGVFENKIGISTGLYLYVKKIESNELKLCFSLQDLINDNYINFSELDINENAVSAITSLSLSHYSTYNKQLSSSRLFKKIPKNVKQPKEKINVSPGPVGVLINGLEIQSPKSFDKIYNGKIRSVSVLNSGSGYNLLNPPKFSVGIPNDTNTILLPSLRGKLEKVLVIDPGYDYVETPNVTLVGGNNDNVVLDVKTKKNNKELFFNANDSDVVNTLDEVNKFIFETPHRLVPGDGIIYRTEGGTPIGIGTEVSDGFLSDNSVYYISNIGSGTSFSIYNTNSDAISGINTINLRTRGLGIQKFVKETKVTVIDEINIVNNNDYFYYKELPFTTLNINTFDEILTIDGHGLENSEEVVYFYEGTPLPNISTTSYYYVKKIDEDSFQLYSNKKLTGNPVNLNYNSTHTSSKYKISYSPIRISIEGKLTSNGISTTGYSAELYPVIRGEFTEVRVQQSSNYGNTYLNVEDSPKINIVKGQSASLNPIVSNGKIVDVIVISSGSNYYNSVEIEIEGVGVGAKLHPIIQNGSVTDVKIVRSGIGYNQYTILKIKEVGKGAFLKANLNYWTLDETSKFTNNQLQGGILIGYNQSNSSQFGLYKISNSLISQLGITTTTHSKIIGWSYDGCPIYGPYAYQNVDGTGNIIQMKSSYKKIKVSPTVDNSSNLNCIEDYSYVDGFGTLDEYNGRYCKTPEFPNGVYAYFATSTYPFFVGNQFFFATINENFDGQYNQSIDINKTNIIKHTYPYYTEDFENYYEYFDFDPTDNENDFIVNKVSAGKINSVNILSSGDNYSIGDIVKFDNTGTGGYGAEAFVSELLGVGISSIGSENYTYDNVVFYNDGNNISGVSTETLQIENDYFIKISNISSSLYSEIEGYRKVKVEELISELTEPLNSNVGLVTSIQITNNILLYEIDSNIEIGNELLKVVGRDYKNNFLIVKRGNESLFHAEQSPVVLLNNKFSIENLDNYSLPKKDEIYYFDSDLISVGIGTSPGSGNTLIKYPLGNGLSETRFARTGSIWMPGHKFKNGERVIYESPEEGDLIQVLGFTYLIAVGNLYIVDFGNDLVGFSTSKKGVKDYSDLIYFEDEGSGKLHRLKTVRNPITGSLSINETTAYTNSPHNLSVGDVINLDVVVGNTTNYTVSYSNSRVRIDSVVNPMIELYRNESVTFDLSSSTLSNTKFDLYLDENYVNKYVGSGTTINEIIRDSNSYTLNINSNTPSKLYYNLKSKTKEINSDTTVTNNNTIVISPSRYNYSAGIVTTTNESYTINLNQIAERDSYVSTGSTILSYSVLSSESTGPIKQIKMKYEGQDYKKLPSITSIGTTGYDAEVYPYSENIGKIVTIKPTSNKVYPIDKTLKPSSKAYTTLYVKDYYKVESVSIDKGGSGYLNTPLVKLYNENTNSIYESFSAFATLKNSTIDYVTIENPGFGIPKNGNKIIFTENSNGVKILESTYQLDGDNYLVSLRLETPQSGFTTSNPLPFEVGDKIFVEGIVSSGYGFNSSDYSYQYFDVVGVVTAYFSPDESIIRYNVEFDPGLPTNYNFAYVINSNSMPSASVSMTQNLFLPGELVNQTKVVDNAKGKISSKDIVNVYSSNDLELGGVVRGKSSQSEGKIQKIEENYLEFKLSESFSKELRVFEDKGYLSSSVQKLQDSYYYQNLSYSLKSNVELEKWNSSVSDLCHIAGLKKFSDLIVESVGISTISSEDIPQVNVSLSSYVNVNTINDIDLVLEDVDENNNLFSETLTFNTLKLSDYLLSIGNRVLSIDDISPNFDTDPIFAALTIDTLESYGEGSYLSKYFVFIESTTSLFTDFELPLLAEVYLIRNGNSTNIISYSYFEDVPLGSFYSQVDPTNSNQILLQFIPLTPNNIISSKVISDSVPLDFVPDIQIYGNVYNVAFTTYFENGGSPTEQYIDLYSLNDTNSGTLFVGLGTGNGYISEFAEFSFTYDGTTLISSKFTDTEISDLGTIEVVNNSGSVSIAYSGIPNSNVYVYTNAHLLVNTTDLTLNIELDDGLLSSGKQIFTATNLDPVSISTVTAEYGVTKFVAEVKKTVGVTTEISFIQINSIHYDINQANDKYLNNVNYNLIGNLNDLEFETIYNENTQSYNFIFYPSELADYEIKYHQKSITRSTNPLL